MGDDGLTPVGEILEAARGEMSKRKAALEAGISEGRWRQIVSGKQRAGGVPVPVNPRRQTIVKMAKAVGADVNAALRAAGFEGDFSEHESEISGVYTTVISEWLKELDSEEQAAVWTIVRNLVRGTRDNVATLRERPNLAWAADHQDASSVGMERRRRQDAAGEEPQGEP